MNVFVIKMGIGIGVALSSFLFIMWMNRRKAAQESHSPMVCGNFDGSSIKNCCICLVELGSTERLISLPCRHRFHMDCIKPIFFSQEVSQLRCPLCRRSVSEEFVLRAFKARGRFSSS